MNYIIGGDNLFTQSKHECRFGIIEYSIEFVQDLVPTVRQVIDDRVTMLRMYPNTSNQTFMGMFVSPEFEIVSNDVPQYRFNITRYNRGKRGFCYNVAIIKL